MLEHAIRLNLVQRSFEKALLIQILVIVIGERTEFLGLLVKELEVRGTLVGNVTVDGLLDFVFIPFHLTIPVILLIVLIEIVIKREVGFLGSILAFCERLAKAQRQERRHVLTLQSGRQGLEESCYALQQPRPTLLDTCGNIIRLQCQKRADRSN